MRGPGGKSTRNDHMGNLHIKVALDKGYAKIRRVSTRREEQPVN